MKTERIRQKIERLRAEIVDGIIEIVKSVGGELHIMDIDDGCSPILQEDVFDGNNTYTLDKITLNGEYLEFDGSSCFANFTWRDDNLDVLMLIGILDFLEKHEDEIEELKGFHYENSGT